MTIGYAGELLRTLGVSADSLAEPKPQHPALVWAASGAMALTGPADGPPVIGPAWIASCMNGALAAFERIAGRSLGLDAAALLGERAACLGLARQGTISPGGRCRLLRTADGWLAVNLARPDDLELLPAWLGEGNASEPWSFVAERIAHAHTGDVVARGRLLGLAVAEAAPIPTAAQDWVRVRQLATPATVPHRPAPLVIDLSSLWAGPLCTHLLALAGARVIKVESTGRPDGTRRGPPAFYDLLNAGKESVALDFRAPADLKLLRQLIERADIVVESSRPRALAGLGLDAKAVVATVPGLTWLSITGYGREGSGANWAAFGDDAAAAAGLATATGAGYATPLFCGDAIADPLTGAHATLAAWWSWQSDGGRLVDLALRDVSAHALSSGSLDGPAEVIGKEGTWQVSTCEARQPVLPPRTRVATVRARELGKDTRAVLSEFSC